MMRVQVKEGEMTKTIYTHIMEQKYDKAVKILNQQLQFFPESRCALFLGFRWFVPNMSRCLDLWQHSGVNA